MGRPKLSEGLSTAAPWIAMALLMSGGGAASATVKLADPSLPPEPEPQDCEQVVSQYENVDLHAFFPGGIDFSNAIHRCFTNVFVEFDPASGDEFESFESIVEGRFDDGSGPQVVELQGPVQILVRGRGGATTGSWQTEMLSMDLSGDMGGIPIQIRESPNQPSEGQTSITQASNGEFYIDSFFDVFTELSLGGGPFEPQTNGPSRVELKRRVRHSAILPTAELPPEPDPLNCERIVSRYRGQDVHAFFPGGVDFSNPIHKCFENVQTDTDPVTGDETETFDSTVEGIYDDGSGPRPVVLTGPVTTVVRRKNGNTTGSWDTEILSMDLSGDVGGISIDIRESPNHPSDGRTNVDQLPSGDFRVDSFFDVFTELSVNGRPFEPQTNPAARLELERVRPKVRRKSQRDLGLPVESNPPNCDRIVSLYRGRDLHAIFPGGIDFNNPIHSCFKNVQVTTDPATGDETETFDTRLQGVYDDGSGPQPVTLTGPVTTVVRGKGASQTGSWQTEMLSMDLSGVSPGGVPIDVRVDPNLESTGQVEIQDQPDGTFIVDSFFDVYTEISVNGGPFRPQFGEPGRVELEPIRPSVRLRHPELPPERDPPNCSRLQSLYRGQDVHALFPGGIDFSNPIHRCFKNVQTTTDPATGDETETFDSIVEGTFDDGTGPQPMVLTGPVTTVVRRKNNDTTGSWDTEILSMDLSGVSPGGVSVEMRESPSEPSPGRTEVRDEGDGRFRIDSFFDVFTEISIDGGPFMPQTNGAGRMDLEPIRPSVVRPDSNLPPEVDPVQCDQATTRLETDDPPVVFPNGVQVIRSRTKCFANQFKTVDPGTGDETSDFEMVMTAIFDDGAGPTLVELSGPVQTVVRGRGSDQTGHWETEMVSMSLSGVHAGIPVELRESPNLPSPGETVVSDAGGGSFRIDSFFDVFTELSVGGGPFRPQTTEASRMNLLRARPHVTLDDPSLPPEPNPRDCNQIVSLYASEEALHALFPNGVDLSNPIHKCFENVQTSTDPGTGDETELFDTTVEAVMDLGSGPQPITLTGPAEIQTFRKSGEPTGYWDTEMVSLSLSGDVGGVPVEVRESPSKASEGETRVDDIGGGQFQIDSFFDVFTEVSVDGGPFMPQSNETLRMELRRGPEPGMGTGLMATLPLLYWLARRRQRR